MTLDDLDAFLAAYIECALWSSHDESDESGGEFMDATYEPGDIAPDSLRCMREDCEGFIEANLADLADLDAAQCGHDFWLTRNGHGAGFWDRGLGEVGQRLTKDCKTWGSCDLYIGDDKLVHCFPA